MGQDHKSSAQPELAIANPSTAVSRSAAPTLATRRAPLQSTFSQPCSCFMIKHLALICGSRQFSSFAQWMAQEIASHLLSMSFSASLSASSTTLAGSTVLSHFCGAAPKTWHPIKQ
eukprot:CAMPEP_0179065740 /NCGR_PEP_ID=MMETSP0796-20121207/28618_1 /TAXON_ID=73915 /ORGANISM="Pyrodinium bahamense, Strain pbaha01" /LENGTH=115 /DNA_ID=CAMNT_0020762725 /DNA_START=53 /DNA_END=400 /DNA_ORIENTATION=+